MPEQQSFTSEATTRQIRVTVTAQYAPEHSTPADKRWFFHYAIEIANEGTETAQLLSRHWVITDANDHVEEVRGLGVVGKQPVLEPGGSFTYTSGCPLTTSFGTMHGTYTMAAADGEQFDIEIAPFTLSESYTVH